MIRFLLLTGVLLAAGRSAASLDLDLYARLLDAHTRDVSDLASVRVDYAALRDDPRWATLVESLAAADPDALGSRAERLAFWINAYNVLAIEVVADHYPLASIRDAGSLFRPVWKREAGRVGGKGISLDRIEHGILRSMGEPRIHGAIVCASLSCPPLRREPYRAETLDAQLDDNARRWLADPRKGTRVDAAAGVLRLSPILDWFAEDFDAVGGVPAFVARHAPEPVARFVRQAGKDLAIRWLDYDWSLNDTARAPGAGRARTDDA